MKKKRNLFITAALSVLLGLGVAAGASTFAHTKPAEKVEAENAPSGTEFYSLNKEGDSGSLSGMSNLNNCTLRFYYINKNQKKDAKVVI